MHDMSAHFIPITFIPDNTFSSFPLKSVDKLQRASLESEDRLGREDETRLQIKGMARLDFLCPFLKGLQTFFEPSSTRLLKLRPSHCTIIAVMIFQFRSSLNIRFLTRLLTYLLVLARAAIFWPNSSFGLRREDTKLIYLRNEMKFSNHPSFEQIYTYHFLL